MNSRQVGFNSMCTCIGASWICHALMLISSAVTQLLLKEKMDATPRFISHSSPVNNVFQAFLHLASSQVASVEAWGEISLQEEGRS